MHYLTLVDDPWKKYEEKVEDKSSRWRKATSLQRYLKDWKTTKKKAEIQDVEVLQTMAWIYGDDVNGK